MLAGMLSATAAAPMTRTMAAYMLAIWVGRAPIAFMAPIWRMWRASIPEIGAVTTTALSPSASRLKSSSTSAIAFIRR